MSSLPGRYRTLQCGAQGPCLERRGPHPFILRCDLARAMLFASVMSASVAALARRLRSTGPHLIACQGSSAFESSTRYCAVVEKASDQLRVDSDIHSYRRPSRKILPLLRGITFRISPRSAQFGGSQACRSFDWASAGLIIMTVAATSDNLGQSAFFSRSAAGHQSE